MSRHTAYLTKENGQFKPVEWEEDPILEVDYVFHKGSGYAPTYGEDIDDPDEITIESIGIITGPATVVKINAPAMEDTLSQALFNHYHNHAYVPD